MNKDLIKKNFLKSLDTYSDNAIVQKLMAQKLVSLIDKKEFSDILEIGSYSGIITRCVQENFTFNNYIALDIIDVSSCLSKDITFIQEDIETFSTDKKFDLIITNAALQWCADFGAVAKKLKSYLKQDGILAISVFSNKNFKEIKETFKVGLNYLSIDELRELFPNALIIDEIRILNFNTPLDILRHLKYTGVNSIQNNNLSYKQIKEKLNLLGTKLTYNPVYIIDRRS